MPASHSVQIKFCAIMLLIKKKEKEEKKLFAPSTHYDEI